MNIVFIFVLIISFIASWLSSIWLLKRRGHKKYSLLVAFLLNTLILCAAAIVLYKIDPQSFHKQTDGFFGSLGIIVLPFFIPILTYLNYIIIIRKRFTS